VYLVCGDRRSPEQRQSYVSESAALRRPRRPVFSLHKPVVRCGAAKGDPSSLIVGSHSGKRAASGHAPFEMIDMSWFKVWARRLIVAPILIQPRNRVRIVAAVRRHRRLAAHFRVGPGNCQRK